MKQVISALIIFFSLATSALAVGVQSSPVPITQFAGIDCAGSADSATGLQNAINAVPVNTQILIPIGCTLKIGTKITWQNRQEVSLVGVGHPTLQWTGANNGTMFDVLTSYRAVFDGLNFRATIGSTIDTFLNFDGQGGGQTPTEAKVLNSKLYPNNGQDNPAYKAIKISETAGQNHESYDFDNLTIVCDGNNTTITRSIVGAITNASTTLTCSDCKFVAGDVGKRLRVSYVGALLDTTVASVTNGTTVVMANAAASTQSNVTVHTGSTNGVGWYLGPSSNAKHQVLNRVQITNCGYGIYQETGSFSSFNSGGQQNDVDIYIANNTEPDLIQLFSSEGSRRQLEVATTNSPVIMQAARMSTGNQFANGFWLIDGAVIAIGNNVEYIPPTNSVIIGDKGTHNMQFLGIGNRFNGQGGLGLSYDQVGFTFFSEPPTLIGNYKLATPYQMDRLLDSLAGDLQLYRDLYVPNVPTTGAATFACFDSNKRLVSKTTACQ